MALDADVCSAYEIMAAAYHANVFYHSPESLFRIHVCWFSKLFETILCQSLTVGIACALVGSDDETLCNIARWFMKEYQFVSDGYRLFSALNRLCDSENSWYNCGPSQKYILRQLKAVDFSLLENSRQKSLIQGRASYTTKDSDGSKIEAVEMDIGLLMLYGSVLHAGKSYAYAVSESAPILTTFHHDYIGFTDQAIPGRLLPSSPPSRSWKPHDQAFPSAWIRTLCTEATS